MPGSQHSADEPQFTVSDFNPQAEINPNSFFKYIHVWTVWKFDVNLINVCAVHTLNSRPVPGGTGALYTALTACHKITACHKNKLSLINLFVHTACSPNLHVQQRMT